MPGETEERLKAEEIKVGNLFRQFIFEVPIYQRPFSWTEEHFRRLVDDIMDALESKEDHYFLGSIILKRIDDVKHEVVDGQQRITALIILLAVARDIIKEMEGSHAIEDATREELKRLRKILQDYIYQPEDPLMGIPETMRLEPWRDLKEILKNYIYTEGQTKKLIQDVESGRIKYADKQSPIFHLYEAVKTFYEFYEGFSDISKLKKFLQYLLSHVYVVYVRTDTRTSAFRLFNVLNTRGLPLTAADILKSVNLEAVEDDTKRTEYATLWRNLEDDLGREELDRVIGFIRTIFAREKAKLEMYEEFEKLFDRGVIKRGAEFFRIVKDFAQIYQDKVLEPDINIDDLALRNQYRILVEVMRRFLPFSDWIPPLLYFSYKFRDDSYLPDFLLNLEKKVFIEWCADFTATQRITSSIGIIRLIDDLGDPEHVIKNLLTYKETVQRGRERRTIDFTKKEEIEKILLEKLNDQQFYTLKGGKLARYVLLRLDMEMWDENFPGYTNISTITVEHILPRNPSSNSEWSRKFNKDQIREWVDKLGNLALLSKRRNSQAANYDFGKKKERYFAVRSTPFRITQMLQNYDDWTPETIAERHNKLLELAKSIYMG